MPVECPLGSGKDSRRPVEGTIRRDGRYRARSGGWRAASATAIAALSSSTALAQDMGSLLDGVVLPGPDFGAPEVIQLAIFAGVMGAALLSAIWMIRERARIAADNLELRGRVADLSASLQRSEALLSLRDQRILIWRKGASKPEILGGLPAESGAPDDRATFLAFGRWLAPRSASAIEAAAVALRDRSKAFDLIIETQSGQHLEVQGRSTVQHVILRFLSVTEARRAHARLRIDHQRLEGEHGALRALLEAVPVPVWLRDRGGALAWVNAAYAKAVEAASPDAAVHEQREFLGSQAREAIVQRRAESPVVVQTLSTVIGGDRRQFLVADVAGGEGSAGLAIDRSEQENLLAELRNTQQAHSGTLDKLATAVAIFDSDEKLRFYNQAFQKLWELDDAFLDSAPDHNLLLDRLRTDGKLAEQPEWRRWKENVLSAYRAIEAQDHSWHLPDGRTVRVMASPNPQGGVTWIFENLTERIDLESRYKTAVRVQSETLDSLAEGVAVFGSDGRLKLANPAFARLWAIDADVARPGVHITTIRAACEAIVRDSPWPDFVAAVTGFDEERRGGEGQVELVTGDILRHAHIHLPNGQVMFTFVDVTDTVNVERALKDKNEALQNADRLKNDFVQHVSYELRSPLTNIMGFTELLSMPETGPLSERQHEYVGHIGSSSAVLLAIVNDILDLATVDAGIMELDIDEVAIADAVNAAAERVAERMRDHDIRLELNVPPGGATFFADGNRIRQILANLLSNASNFAPAGSTVTLSCRVGPRQVVFSIHDDGPGMPPEVLDTVYRRFESRANGGRRRGAGLGLSIVKSFVELHGGTIDIQTGAGIGTTVTCTFPVAPDGLMAAAQ